jgi:hypothetical protein
MLLLIIIEKHNAFLMLLYAGNMAKKFGSKLDSLARRWMPSHYRVIEPLRREILISNQYDFLDDSEHGRKVDHHAVGDYYEFLTWGLYGGEVFNKWYLRQSVAANDDGGSFLADFDDSVTAKPDVVNLQTREIWESKSLSPGRACKLDDAQIAGYQNLQFQRRDYRISFVLYRYGLVRVDSYQGGLSELCQDLGEQTFFSVELPLSVVIALHDLPIKNKHERGKEVAYREDNELFEPRTLIKSGFVNYLFERPREALERIGLSVSDYVIERWRSPFDFYFVLCRTGGDKRCIVRPFPMLIVRNKDNGNWVDGFVHNMENGGDAGTNKEKLLRGGIKEGAGEGDGTPGDDVPF